MMDHADLTQLCLDPGHRKHGSEFSSHSIPLRPLGRGVFLWTSIICRRIDRKWTTGPLLKSLRNRTIIVLAKEGLACYFGGIVLAVKRSKIFIGEIWLYPLARSVVVPTSVRL